VEVLESVQLVREVEPVGNLTAIDADSDPGTAYHVSKRLIDVAVSALALTLLSPVWALIAAAIKWTTPGPMLYRTPSLGRNARPFTLYKFRTMVDGADEAVHRKWIAGYVKRDQPFAVRKGEDGTPEQVFKIVNDPRVTPLGRWLRRTGLDEVPQFINVLRGEMSVVGPRSPRPFEYEHYDDRARRRVTIKPGITGLYQVTARATASFSQMVALDLEYARRRSILLDVSIMVRTVPVMVLGRGGF
jgi:lipopolysaccharide/colanic/teichoic acid biosynthesis glycosyltransferase